MRDVAWQPPIAGVPLQVFTWRELVGRVDDAQLAAPQRLRFSLVMLCTDGSCTPSVDFVAAELRPGTYLYIEAGQVMQWDLDAAGDARIAVFVGNEIRVRRWPEGPLRRSLPDGDVGQVHQALDIAAAEMTTARTPQAKAVALAAARDLLFVRLGLMDVGVESEEPTLSPVVRAFRSHIESHLDASISVQQRAAALGYSTRTIARACHEATGRTPKQLCDDRLALEAKRLLGQPDRGVGDVSRLLGFSEPTNFTKFFKRVTGSTPLDWKDNLLGRQGVTSMS